MASVGHCGFHLNLPIEHPRHMLVYVSQTIPIKLFSPIQLEASKQTENKQRLALVLPECDFSLQPAPHLYRMRTCSFCCSLDRSVQLGTKNLEGNAVSNGFMNWQCLVQHSVSLDGAVEQLSFGLVKCDFEHYFKIKIICIQTFCPGTDSYVN